MLKTKSAQASIILAIAALFGGGGSGFGLSNLVVQLAAFTALAINYDAVRQFVATVPRPLLALVLATLSLPLLQLVPLPPDMWSGLPGRQLVSEAYAFARGPDWTALTVSQARTFVAFIGLIAPFALIVLGWSLDAAARDRLIDLVIAIGLLNLVPGIAEVLNGNGQSLLYPANSMPGVMFGLFANRNSTGLFLDCCLLLLVARSTRSRAPWRKPGKAMVAILLVLGVILTQSRSSIALLTLPAGLALAKVLSPNTGASASTRPIAPRMLFAAVVGAVLVAALVPVMGNSRLSIVADRFEQGDGQRSLIWEDARFAAQRYWPAGAGMGTFDEVFQVDESLEYVSQRRAGRAHNDYLELAIEAGVFGLILALGWSLWIIQATWRASRTPLNWPALAGSGILLAMALQSLLDFPLRNQTMLCLAAFAILLVAPLRISVPANALSDDGAAS